MFNWVDLKTHQDRQQNLQREAEKERLIRKVLKGLPRREDEAVLKMPEKPLVSKN
jgi:hypothetical protein